MRKIFTLLVIMISGMIYAQEQPKMVLIPDYPIDYEIRLNDDLDVIVKDTHLQTRTKRTGDIFVIGNFNRLTIIRPMIDIPRTTVNNNNAEYIKTTQFNPDKSLQEILRDDKK